jgi:tetratricopeptide (TPR) repeat protein
MHKISIAYLVIIVMIIISNNVQIKGQNKKAEQLYQELAAANNDTLQIMAMYNLYRFYYSTKVDSALYFAKEAYHLSKKNSDYELGRVAMALGHAYHQVADYEKAIIYLTEAYNIARKLKYEGIYAVLLSDLGMCYHFLNDFEQAMGYYQEALKLSTDYNGRIVSYINIAQVYGAKENYSEAYNYYRKALEETRKEKNFADEAMVYNRLGELFMMEKDYKKAIDYYQQSLDMVDTIGGYYKVVNYRSLAELNLLTKNYKQGVKYALLTDSLSVDGGFLYEQQYAKKILSELYDSLKIPELSLKNYKEYALIKDSIFSSEKNDRINYLHVEFQTKEKEMQLEIMQKEAALKNKMLIIYAILSILVVVVLLYFIKNGRLKNKVLQYEKEKEILKQQKLEQELNQKKRELLSHVMQISQQKDILLAIQKNLRNIAKSENPKTINKELQSINTDIKARLNQTDGWQHIKMHFENVHPNFFKQIKEDYPSLSANDLKLCAYTKLNLSGKETSQLLNINLASVQMARYRLKKKMNIDEELSLDDFILSNY